MRDHHAYRLPISLMYDAPLDDGSRASELGLIDVYGDPDPLDPISRILASRPPPEYFGRYWNDQILRGSEAAESLGPDRYLEVAFEQLVADPRETLGQIAMFLELHGSGVGGGSKKRLPWYRGFPRPVLRPCRLPSSALWRRPVRRGCVCWAAPEFEGSLDARCPSGKHPPPGSGSRRPRAESYLRGLRGRPMRVGGRFLARETSAFCASGRPPVSRKNADIRGDAACRGVPPCSGARGRGRRRDPRWTECVPA